MVSGGSDSTALAYAAREMHDAGALGPLAVLHVNHKLRGQDAEDDARFVAALAEALELPLYLREIDVARAACEQGGNVEALAREARYRAADEALADLCRRVGTPAGEGRIFTAHTLDDRAESFYMRSIVGTGPGGFRAMRYLNGQIARPLLDETRASLRAYLEQRAADAAACAAAVRDDAGALWREDATNARTDRFRAYVRHEIVPRVRQWNPRALDALARSMNLIADEDDMLDDMAAEVERRCARQLVPGDSAEGFLLLPALAAEPRPLQRRAAHRLLAGMLGPDARIEAVTVETLLAAFSGGAPRSGYVANIQGDVAVSANKAGVRVEPMARFRARRKRL